MFKRYLLLGLCLALVVSVAPAALAHDPDNPADPFHTHESLVDQAALVNAASADDSAADTAAQPAPTGFVMPDWLTPYEHVPAPQASGPMPQANGTALQNEEPAPVQPIVIWTKRSQLLKQTDETVIIRDGDTITYWRRIQTRFVERIEMVIRKGEMIRTLFSRRSFAMLQESRIIIKLPPAQDSRANGMTIDDYLGYANWFSQQGDLTRAARSLEQALELDASHHDARCQLGAIYRDMGDDAAALAQLNHVLANDSGNACAQEQRQDMLGSAATASEKRALLAVALSPGR